MMNKASHGEIAQHAYAIWEREGRPHGRDFDHWLKAEREIQSVGPAAKAPRPAATRATSVAVKAKSTTTRARKPKKT